MSWAEIYFAGMLLTLAAQLALFFFTNSKLESLDILCWVLGSLFWFICVPIVAFLYAIAWLLCCLDAD